MSLLKSWNGSSWTTHSGWANPKIWNGSSWVPINPKHWDGSQWKTGDFLDSQTTTNGSYSDKYTTSYGYNTGLMGSINDGTSDIYGGATITALYETIYPSTMLYFYIGANVANSGWTTMTVNGTAFNRASATYTNGASTYWYWSSTPGNLFTGGTSTIIFT